MLVGLLTASFVASCGFGGSVDPSYPYWVLNDSDGQVIVDIHVELHQTYVVPPHTYGSVYQNMGLDRKFTIAVVDDQCRALQTWTLDEPRNLVYIAPDGDREFTSDLAWSHGLRTAKSMDFVQRVPICP